MVTQKNHPDVEHTTHKQPPMMNTEAVEHKSTADVNHTEHKLPNTEMGQTKAESSTKTKAESSTNADVCKSPPPKCGNRGVCVPGGGEGAGDYRCQCPFGYVGPRCQSKLRQCLVDVCKNGATCVEARSTIRCLCPPGYRGTYCHQQRKVTT